ncbi:hypothetical protein BS47DRAFT_1374544 [Hydnum rufescens UP504]|uniref:Signal peptidase subunit 3 n=1 Tax=Hydnum rufescens UP504 TaxID=1448309 RepID=A0A9P6E2G1_9AGAM|nr:hypothetical protein BS47DRAFT_1374544 [Hydnum rufescens UP504]
MHSLYQRANGLTGLLSSCLIGLLALVALTSFLFPAHPKGDVNIKTLKVRWGQIDRHPAQEWAFVQFDLQTDLESLFHWNTKQLFVYLVAEYTGSKGVANEVVLWDRIAKIKYVFRDFNKTFRNASAVELSVRYNVMPYVGVLTSGEVGRTSKERFPALQTQG